MALFGVALARYLDEQGIGEYDELGAGGDIFYAEMPAAPDKAVMVMPTGGLPLQASGTLPYDAPTVQIMIRGERGQHVTGERLAWRIYDALNGLHRVTLDSGGEDEIYLVGMTVPIPPVHIGTDSQGRSRWSINPSARVKRPSVHRP